ncbi:MAG: AAA family ATPase [Acidobacteria bacterium]|nr:AAA family ATPase [Acidobacteriota bacterium]
MLTRFQVSGFKNLLDLDVRFGPFNCIIGANGVGKSNLFDAIHFLSLLADRPLMDAAAAVRDSGRKTRDILGLFYRCGDYVAHSMDFTIEVVVPREAEDDYGQTAYASNTMLRYAVSIGRLGDHVALLKEELQGLPLDTPTHFAHSEEWRRSLTAERPVTVDFIDTAGGAVVVRENETRSYPIANLKRTILSASNTADHPTIFAMRRELQSWMQLQLEPSALRRADELGAPTRISLSGEHMSAALDRIVRGNEPEDLYVSLANRLAELAGKVRRIRVERDEARGLITTYVTFADGTSHPASSLSDGMLRFLALAILEKDPLFEGLLCLEEPENGMHPERIGAMIRLLNCLTADPDFAVDADNPLRQVIVNTHSPTCAAEVAPDALLIAEPELAERNGVILPTMRLSALSGTWRTRAGAASAKPGTVLGYIHPVAANGSHRDRVADRPELQPERYFQD